MIKNKFFDDLETRSNDERISNHLKKLNELVKKAKQNKNQSLRFSSQIKDLNDLSVIPLLSSIIFDEQQYKFVSSWPITSVKRQYVSVALAS